MNIHDSTRTLYYPHDITSIASTELPANVIASSVTESMGGKILVITSPSHLQRCAHSPRDSCARSSIGKTTVRRMWPAHPLAASERLPAELTVDAPKLWNIGIAWRAIG